jgi:hypothetical protein
MNLRRNSRVCLSRQFFRQVAHAGRCGAKAFVETCQHVGLPAAVERSRSGNGAHVWFFFSSPVPAATARKMGCHLITETMSRRHELSMESYDRLFPSHDTMPRGGFGNLIALPLQHGPRALGNSVFVDDRLPLTATTVTVISVPIINDSPTRLVKISTVRPLG